MPTIAELDQQIADLTAQKEALEAQEASISSDQEAANLTAPLAANAYLTGLGVTISGGSLHPEWVYADFPLDEQIGKAIGVLVESFGGEHTTDRKAGRVSIHKDRVPDFITGVTKSL